MEYPRHLFKHPGSYGEGARSYKVTAAADEAEEAALLADGWHLTKEAAWGLDSLDKEAGKKVEPPPPSNEIAELRAAYKAKLGKGAFNGWDADTLKAKIAAALAKDDNGD